MKKPQVRRTEPWVYLAGAGGVFALIMLVMMLVTFLPEPKKVKQVRTRPAQIRAKKPEAIVSGFLTQIQLNEVSPAYRFLSRRIQAKLPREVFATRLNRWSQAEIHRWEMRHRRVESVVVEGTSAWARISPPPQGREWKWKLVQEADGWKIDQLEGLPVENVQGQAEAR